MGERSAAVAVAKTAFDFSSSVSGAIQPAHNRREWKFDLQPADYLPILKQHTSRVVPLQIEFNACLRYKRRLQNCFFRGPLFRSRLGIFFHSFNHTCRLTLIFLRFFYKAHEPHDYDIIDFSMLQGWASKFTSRWKVAIGFDVIWFFMIMLCRQR